MAVGDVYKVALVMRLQDSICVNTFHYRVETEVVNIDHSILLMSTLWGTIGDPYRQGTTTALSFLQLESHMVVTNPGGTFIQVLTPVTGVLADLTFPSEVSGVVKKISPRGGRQFRGRVYVPGMPNGSIDETFGVWSAARMIKLQAIADAITSNLDDFAGTSFTPGVLRVSTGVFTQTGTGQVNPVPRSQRRRQAGVGI